MVLEYFKSDSLNEPNVDSCDVCAMEVVLLTNRKKELALVIKAIEALGKCGEKKIAQFIPGGSLAWIRFYRWVCAVLPIGTTPSRNIHNYGIPGSSVVFSIVRNKIATAVRDNP